MYDNPFSTIPAGVWVVYCIILLIIIIAWWNIFEKAGQPGWKAIIPLYNAYILLKIVGKPDWWLLMFFIPFVNFVFIIWTYNMLSKSFGKEEAFFFRLRFSNSCLFP